MKTINSNQRPFEIMQKIPEDHEVQFQYNLNFYLEDQQRHQIATSRWSKNMLYNNLVEIEKLLAEALHKKTTYY